MRAERTRGESSKTHSHDRHARDPLVVWVLLERIDACARGAHQLAAEEEDLMGGGGSDAPPTAWWNTLATFSSSCGKNVRRTNSSRKPPKPVLAFVSSSPMSPPGMTSRTRSRKASVGPNRTETLNASAGTSALCVPLRPELRPADGSIEATMSAEVVVVDGAPSVMRPGTAALIAALSESSCALRRACDVCRSESANLKTCCRRQGGKRPSEAGRVRAAELDEEKEQDAPWTRPSASESAEPR